jgi:hypothetical protein
MDKRPAELWGLPALSKSPTISDGNCDKCGGSCCKLVPRQRPSVAGLQSLVGFKGSLL